MYCLWGQLGKRQIAFCGWGWPITKVMVTTIADKGGGDLCVCYWTIWSDLIVKENHVSFILSLFIDRGVKANSWLYCLIIVSNISIYYVLPNISYFFQCLKFLCRRKHGSILPIFSQYWQFALGRSVAFISNKFTFDIHILNTTFK